MKTTTALRDWKTPWEGLPWWFSGKDSELPVQGAWIQSLVRKLDPTCCTKDPACCNEYWRPCMRQLRPVTKYINIKGKTNCIQVPPTGYLQMNSQTDENKGSYHMMEKLLISPQNWGRGELGRTGPSIKENKNTMTLKKPKNHGSQTQALQSGFGPQAPRGIFCTALRRSHWDPGLHGLSPAMPSAGSGVIAWCALQEQCSDPGGLVPTETHHTPTGKSILICCSPTCIAQCGSLWPHVDTEHLKCGQSKLRCSLSVK